MKPYENINRDALAALSNTHDRVIDLEPGIDYEISSPAEHGVDGHLDYPVYDDDDFHGVDWPAAFGLAAAGWGIIYVAWHLIRWVL